MNPTPYIYPGLVLRGNNLHDILDAVCYSLGVDKIEVKGRSRYRRYVIARQLYCHFARKTGKYTTTEIGSLISRDHSSVIYSCKMVEEFIGVKDRYITKEIEKLKILE